MCNVTSKFSTRGEGGAQEDDKRLAVWGDEEMLAVCFVRI
jgi:hypothetical protein